jgi:hypothetical protein
MARLKQPRSSARKVRHHGAWITLDGDIRSHECQVVDISAGGAKLVCDVGALIGSSLTLSLSPNAIVRRPCAVVWRRGRQLGVRFVG